MASLLACAVLVIVVAALFRPALSRYFCSEDFPLLKSLADRSPWAVLWRDLTSPWLDTTFVRFYRPVTSFVLALEVKVLGLDEGALHRAQLLWHLGNVLLVFRLSRLLFARVGVDAPWLPAFWVALLFGTWPLQPNAASFVAGLSNLLHATACLVALDAWLRYRDGGRRRWLGVSASAFLLGLGAYEAAVMIPVALAAWHLLQGTPRSGAEPLAGGRVLVLCFGLPLLGYFVLRRVLLGDWIGGYDSGVLGEEIGASGFLRDPLRSLALLVHPHFQRAATPWADLWWCGAAYLAPLVVFLVWAARGRRRLAGTGLFALAWTGICLAPFLGQPILPSTGRYWYLACLGPLWATMLVAAGLRGRAPGRFLLPTLLGAAWLWQGVPLLKTQVERYREAGHTSRRIHEELAALSRTLPQGQPLFLGNVPTFVRDGENLPVAPVYWYGLRDSANPPFLDRPLDLFPLPLLRDGMPPAIALTDPGLLVFGWHPGRQRLVRQDAAETVRRLPEWGEPLEVLEPRDGAVLPAGEDAVTVRVRARGASLLRLVVATPSASWVARWQPSSEEEVAAIDVRPSLLVYQRQFHPEEPLYWWVEARDAQGRLTGTTRMHALRFAPAP